MEGEFDGFEDDLDDDLLRTLPLDFPFDTDDLDCVAAAEQVERAITLEVKKEQTLEIIVEECDGSSEGSSQQPSPVAPPIDTEGVAIPSEFPFPFQPYDIQVGFMRELYKTLELGKIGIFESPTGTGKSLSLICGALQWLKDYEEKQREELEQLLAEKARESPVKKKEEDQNSKELDWIAEFAKKQEKNEQAKKLKEEQEQRLRREVRLQQLRTNLRPVRKHKRKRDSLEDKFDELFKDAPQELKEKLQTELENGENQSKECQDEDDNIVVAEYQSDEETSRRDENSGDEEEDDQNDHVTKIYYCSRTHSQLSQFVREVQKSPFGEDTRVVSLGSRQNLCINEGVKKLNSISLINDRCLELQKNKSATKKKNGEALAKKKKSSGGCPFYKQDPVQDFTDRTLVEVRDIEQLVTMGRQMKACPYYGTRHAIPAAHLVALPYNTLLHKHTRQKSGIKLKDNIVIIDEAHNLTETISNVHSVEITGAQVTCAFSQLKQYMDRFRSRLKAKNLMYIKQILFILSSFVKYLGGKTGVAADQQKLDKSETKLQTINDFLFDSHLDNLNIFKILKYCERSMISKKLHGFVEKYQPSVVLPVSERKKDETPTWALSKFLKEISQAKENVESRSPGKSREEDGQTTPVLTSPMMLIESFLEALTNANKDGRILVNKQDLLSRSSLKFLLLNPAVHFTEILQEARAVIVAGGTMQPLSEFKDQLFFAAGAQQDRIRQYSCGHVIPREQLLAVGLARGSSGLELDFTYQTRDQPAMMDELGRVVYNVCNVVPGGIVCFFPSYEYERVVYEHWEKSGFLSKIYAKKKVFREPKKSGQVDHILQEYTSCIRKNLARKYSPLTGALLLCVVGGKMSEGINFSDELGRCVIMVGLPYPNMRSPELKEKMDYLNANMPRAPDGRLPGQIHYENLCFKAVNQSIGRAIRHKDDYASILLLDHRYLRPSMRSKLPGWIADRLITKDRFGPAFASIRKFFSEKKDYVE